MVYLALYTLKTEINHQVIIMELQQQRNQMVRQFRKKKKAWRFTSIDIAKFRIFSYKYLSLEVLVFVKTFTTKTDTNIDIVMKLRKLLILRRFYYV
uniref:Uncharacterized protein n=1 Tax=Octopus bimaculoides TaxID=37653 RepID=A0A0L8GM97_OCTBM